MELILTILLVSLISLPLIGAALLVYALQSGTPVELRSTLNGFNFERKDDIELF